MRVDIWLDDVSDWPQETIHPPPYETAEECKENQAPSKKRRLSTDMDEDGDLQKTPRPSKKSNIRGEAIFEPLSLPSTPSLSSRSESSCANDDLESHKSGRMSPTKQMAQLEDQEHPVVFYDFEMPGLEIPEDVEKLRAKAQRLADGVGILGAVDGETLAAYLASATPLSRRDLDRFGYPFAISDSAGRRPCSLAPLRQVQDLVATAVKYESNRAHEDQWNEDVHSTMIKMALAASIHAKSLAINSLKTATIDPKDLASSALPRRVIDYCYTLKPDHKITAAWSRLRPLPKAGIKSWNNTTRNDVRASPIAVNIETKAPNKSWTDGKAQLGIWITSLLTRLRLLPEYDSINPQPAQGLAIPAMPLIIVQGHDWHLLIVSQTLTPLKTTVWQKIDMGNTRNCFDAHKVIAILHLLADWAEMTWRPWFHTLLEKPDTVD